MRIFTIILIAILAIGLSACTQPLPFDAAKALAENKVKGETVWRTFDKYSYTFAVCDQEEFIRIVRLANDADAPDLTVDSKKYGVCGKKAEFWYKVEERGGVVRQEELDQQRLSD